jgi:hypothetical protein
MHMPDNPYHNLFDESAHEPDRASVPMEEDAFEVGKTVEPLEVIKGMIADFKDKSDAFSVFLSQTRAIDHLEEARSNSIFLSFFIDTSGHKSRESLVEEREHYARLQEKFDQVITQMKDIALLHLDVVKRFNADIDEHYFSLEKTQEHVRIEIKAVIAQINLQRRILGNAARDLDILDGALQACEARLKRYIDIGGLDNLSASEYAMLRQTRADSTSGLSLSFNYAFFEINLIDKLAITFDIYMKKTTGAYLQNLLRAMDHNAGGR